MIKSELIRFIAQRLPSFTHADHAAAVDAILSALAVALAKGDRVEIRGFGTFATHMRTGRIGRNPRSGAAVVVPEKRVVHFRPGQAVRNAIADAGSVRQGKLKVRNPVGAGNIAGVAGPKPF